MKEKISGIILGTVRHNDRHNVTGIYTRERGRMALLTPAGSSKKSRMAASRLQPLSVVEAQVNVSAIRDIQIPASISPLKVWRTIYYEPVKMSVVMFISEFLNRLLRDAPSDPYLWDYIMHSVTLFDLADHPQSIANFHITFLIGLMHHTGIAPNLSEYSEGMEFDMKAGRMVIPYTMQSGGRSHRIDSTRSAFIPILSRINYANNRHFKLSGRERSEILDGILNYFGSHFPGCDNLKSLDILKELFE